MDISPSYSIIFVADMSRSTAFYRDVLKLPLKFESPEWTEFATSGVTIALHKAVAGGAVDDNAGPTPAGRCIVGFSVADLDRFHAEMTARDVECRHPPTEEFGVKLARYLDPDGLPFSVSQRRT